jgi:hypothetical protein
MTLDKHFSQQTVKCTDISVTTSGRQTARVETLMVLVGLGVWTIGEQENANWSSRNVLPASLSDDKNFKLHFTPQ